jgi:hypothetical protein
MWKLRSSVLLSAGCGVVGVAGVSPAVLVQPRSPVGCPNRLAAVLPSAWRAARQELVPAGAVAFSPVPHQPCWRGHERQCARRDAHPDAER